MQQLKIASLGQGNKTAYDAKGNRYFVPERFRSLVKTGEYMLVDTKHFAQSADRNADGTPKLNADGTPVLIDKPFDRTEITMVGDFKVTTLALKEDVVNDGLADLIVKAEIKKQRAELKLTEADLLEAVGG